MKTQFCYGDNCKKKTICLNWCWNVQEVIKNTSTSSFSVISSDDCIKEDFKFFDKIKTRSDYIYETK